MRRCPARLCRVNAWPGSFSAAALAGDCPAITRAPLVRCPEPFGVVAAGCGAVEEHAVLYVMTIAAVVLRRSFSAERRALMDHDQPSAMRLPVFRSLQGLPVVTRSYARC